jgi:hypothetical protein
MGEPVLEIRNVTNGVLQDLNLIVEKGDFYYWICIQKSLTIAGVEPKKF